MNRIEKEGILLYYSIQDTMYLILFWIVIGVIPGVLTIWNIYNFFAKKPKYKRIIAWLTIWIGGFLYYFLYEAGFQPSGDWKEAVYVYETHYSISSQYGWTVVVPVILGLIALLILYSVQADRQPPLFAAFLIAFVVIFNVISIAFAIQIGNQMKSHSDGFVNMFLYLYQFNLFVLSVSAVKNHMREQIKLYQSRRKNAESTKMAWLYCRIRCFERYPVLVFACFFFIIAVFEILFILAGQGADAPIKAFTDTADWTFSQQIPPPPMESSGHYLCTVAAGGHKKIVKPLRYGTRRGQTIVVNRQLCITNAFEEWIQEKSPKIHKAIRNFYDRYGYPVSRHITTPLRADVVYFLMKPLEWGFVVFLYFVDIQPEERIRRQYVLKNHIKNSLKRW